MKESDFIKSAEFEIQTAEVREKEIVFHTNYGDSFMSLDDFCEHIADQSGVYEFGPSHEPGSSKYRVEVYENRIFTFVFDFTAYTYRVIELDLERRLMDAMVIPESWKC